MVADRREDTQERAASHREFGSGPGRDFGEEIIERIHVITCDLIDIQPAKQPRHPILTLRGKDEMSIHVALKTGAGRWRIS
jgi:hypothetical protein